MRPNGHCVAAVINACGKAGRLEEAMALLLAMRPANAPIVPGECGNAVAAAAFSAGPDGGFTGAKTQRRLTAEAAAAAVGGAGAGAGKVRGAKQPLRASSAWGGTLPSVAAAAKVSEPDALAAVGRVSRDLWCFGAGVAACKRARAGALIYTYVLAVLLLQARMHTHAPHSNETILRRCERLASTDATFRIASTPLSPFRRAR